MKIIIILLLYNFIFAQNKFLIDNFNDISNWEIIKSDGAELKISLIEGKVNKGIKIEYNFIYNTGFCGIQKKIPLKLPINYRFSFFIKGDSPNNNFEIKFLDKNKENVWWMNNINFNFPSEWEKFFVRKDDIRFAWGPSKNNILNEFEYIEFTIASYSGGNGTIYIDELMFEELNDSNRLTINVNNERFSKLLDNDPNTIVSIASIDEPITFAFNQSFELGGLKINWDDNLSKNIKVYSSSDSVHWNELLNVSNITKKISYFLFKNLEAQFLKFYISGEKIVKIQDIKILDYKFAKDYNNIFFDLASTHYSDFLPKYFTRQSSYWTVVGMESDEKEALINTEGMIEVDKNSFSLMPFLQVGEEILTYKNFSLSQSLEKNYLPIPIVIWENNNFKLVIKTFSFGKQNYSTKLFVEYQLINKTKFNQSIKLHLAILPFQVNPYYQFLNNPGGVSKINSIQIKNDIIIIDDKTLLTNNENYHLYIFDFNKNDAWSALLEKNFNNHEITNNNNKLNSAIITYPINNKDTAVIRLIYDYYSSLSLPVQKLSFDKYWNEEYNSVINFWLDKLNKTSLTGSSRLERLFEVVKTNLAYILINKDYSGIQPGSRSYERSWIRDGSLTSTALLRFGFQNEVKEFINWYSNYIYENGKVPCVVDKRGPDPVIENDSHGEFIYLLNSYFQFTKDIHFVRDLFPVIKKIVQYIESQIQLRKTEIYKIDSLSVFYGIMPESISHEGYSAKPMHSFWDDFFTCKGLKDATELARILKKNKDIQYFESLYNEFCENLINSINLTIKKHNIDYIPGCVELGDFDPTATSIALFPCEQTNILPRDKLESTYNKYYDYFKNRMDKNEFYNFTPYEIRNVNSFLILGEKNKAIELIDFMMNYQRPKLWNHWAEVVWCDSSIPEFIGDMPHTWVGSEYINVFYNMFLIENHRDSTLFLLSGYDDAFINNQNFFEIKDMITTHGNLNLRLVKKSNKKYEIEISGGIKLNGWKCYLINPRNQKPKSVFINSKKVNTYIENKILIPSLPSKIEINYY